jgi:uncharacterized protein YndB with AHSA1/START domain
MEHASDQSPVLRRSVELDVSAEQLWELVADPARLTEWLGDAVDIDMQAGGTGTVTDDGVLKFVHVDQINTGRRLSFSWWEPDLPDMSAQVVFEIAELSSGRSRLDITETLSANGWANGSAQGRASAQLSAATRQQRWEARVCLLWACTVVAALLA